MKNIFLSLIVLFFFVGMIFFIFQTEKNLNSNFKFNFGLSLSGGSHLIYNVDLSTVKKEEIENSLLALKNVIENRLNQFGFSEVLVQTEKPNLFSKDNLTGKILIDLPGVLDPEIAKQEIGKLPYLEFKIRGTQIQKTEDPVNNPIIELETNFDNKIEESIEGESMIELATVSNKKDISGNFTKDIKVASPILAPKYNYIDVGLNGSHIKSSQVFNDLQTREINVVINFNSDGAKIFEEITKKYLGDVLAIFLDGQVISDPVIQSIIAGGQASISGNFTFDESKELSRNINFGALPLKVEPISIQKISPVLGEDIIKNIITSTIIGFILVSLILIYFYRSWGLIAASTLLIYLTLIIVLFKLFGIVLTVSGIAGIVISIGFAVDANILIFERMREEKIEKGQTKMKDIILNGFQRSWSSVRDGNLSSLIISIIIFYLTSSSVKGFAFVFGLSVLVSMISAITLTRIFLLAIYQNKNV